MADRGETVAVLHQLKIGAINEDWVKAAWDGDFGDFDGLPLEIEEDFMENNSRVPALKAIQEALLPWSRGEETRQGEGLWSVLVEESLPYKNLVGLVFGIIETGLKRVANGSQKEAAVVSAGIYFTLLRVPGSGAFKIFHPMLFQRALRVFKIWTQLDGVVPKRKRTSISPPRASQASQGSRRSKSRRKNKHDEPARQEEEDPFAGDEEEEEEEMSSLSAAEVGRLQKSLIQLLRVYVGLLKSFTLRDCEQSAFTALQTLAELSKMEPETCDGKFDTEIDIERMRTIPQLAYKGLELLCSEMHGDQGAMVTMVFKHLLPSLLMFVNNNKGVAASSIPRHVQNIKDLALNFIRYLMSRLPSEAVMPAVRVLLQHMCAKVPDKVDYRAKVAQSIIILMRDMSASACARMTEWIYKYSRNPKISWRGFALDIVSLLLAEPERDDDAVQEDLRVFLSHHFLLQVLLARCSDVAPTVRSRAISTFAHCMGSEDQSVASVVRDIMTPQVIGGRGPMTRIIPTPETTLAVEAGTRSRVRVSTDGSVPGVSTPGTPASDTNPVTPGSNPPSIQSPLVKILSKLSLMAGTPENSITGEMMTIQLTPGLEITLSDGKGVTSMLRRRAGDDKVNVRKSALQALEGIVNLTDDFNKQDLDIIEERCRDPALSVRKQALQCLTSLLNEKPHNPLIQRAWLNGVLPTVMDRETTAQDKSLEIIEDTILNSIVKKDRSTETRHLKAWDLLKIMASSGQVELRRFLQKACQFWGKAGKLKSSVIIALQSHVATENNEGAWMLLAEMASFASKFDTSFIVDYWEEHARVAPEMTKTSKDGENHTVEKVLVVLGLIAKNIPAEKCQLLADDMKQRLMKFNSAPELTAATVTALNKLCLAQSDDKHAVKKLTDQWFGQLLKACDQYLSTIILNQNHDSQLDEDAIIRHLFTLGEMAQLCPTKTPKRVFMLVQSLIAAPVISADMSSHSLDSAGSTTTASIGAGSNMTTASNDPASTTTASNEPASTVNDDLHTSTTSQASQPADSSQLSQPLSQASQLSQPLSQASQPFSQFSQDVLSQFRGSRMSGRVRAHAFLTLGKLCLQNQELAKKCVAALARELEVSNDPTVRNNVVVIMSDLCVRYTTLVDRYVPNISTCLKDSSPLIRKQCLTLLTRLLQEDFLKWKGSLFYHFVITIVDDLKEIRDFADFCLIHLLMQRHPGMFYQHFIECIFYFNGYDKHSVYNRFSQSERERKLFSLKGKQNSAKRLRIYHFLLEHMPDEHRFQLTAKLCQEILAGLVDGAMELDSDTQALLQDTLAILSSKEIKLSTMRTKCQDDVAETEQEMAAVVMNVAKKTLITQVIKKNVIENVVPTVISLKHMLEKNRSPVLKDLMMFLNELMKDYKSEVKDVMSADPQLAKEIEYDLRKFEEQQEEERLAQQARTAANTPTGPRTYLGRSPGTPPSGPSTPRVNNPRLPGTPRVRGTPRLPGTPGVPGTPKVTGTPLIYGTPRVPGSPAMVMTPGPAPFATPARPLPMSTVAVINSARKIVESQRNKSPISMGGTSPAGTANPSKKVGFKNATPPAVQDSQKEDKFKTPDKQGRRNPRVVLRAISTPTANLTLSNITFHQDMNLSMIPGSPVSTTTSVLSQEPSTPVWTRRLIEDEDGSQKEQFIMNMLSPERPVPKPKTWNIKSPNSSRLSGKKKPMPDDPQATDDPPAIDRLHGDHLPADNTSTVTRPRRTRSKDQSALMDTSSTGDTTVDGNSENKAVRKSTRSKQRKQPVKSPATAHNDTDTPTHRMSSRSRSRTK